MDAHHIQPTRGGTRGTRGTFKRIPPIASAVSRGLLGDTIDQEGKISARAARHGRKKKKKQKKKKEKKLDSVHRPGSAYPYHS